jgi:hypothetical protein
MTNYIVHIYREMRLSFADIEAETPHAAVAIAQDKPTSDADNIEDCDGDNLSAVVDVAGDEDHSQSVTIDFEDIEMVKATRAAIDMATEVISPREPAADSRFEIDLAADLPDHLYFEVDRRFNVVIERTESGLEFRIYPRTAGELWDSPFTTFEVDEAEILELEKEIEL